MIHECPKCKFAQPKDRYCANCGLDIDAYRPEPESFIKKLGKNTGLHIAIGVLIICALGALIFVTQRNKLALHLQNSPNKTTDYRTVKTSPESEESESTLQGISASAETTGQQLPAAALPALPSSEAVPTAAHKSQKELVVTFAEVSKVLLQQLEAEGQTLNETAQTHAFTHATLKDIAALKERDPEFKILTGGQTLSLRPENPLQFDFTHLETTSGQDVGLNLEFLPQNIAQASIELDLDGTYNLKFANSQNLSSQDIRANFVFASQNTLVVTGILPHQTAAPENLEAFSNTPLEILESPQFLSGSTEFVIFVQAK